MPGWIHRLFTRAFSRRRPTTLEIRLGAHDLTLVRVDGAAASAQTVESAFRWSDVQSISAFKRDQFTVDEVCLAFDVGWGVVELNEDTKGYPELARDLPNRFPGFDIAGLSKIVLPPFSTNWSELWRRPPPTPPEPPNDRQLAASLWIALYTGMMTHRQVVAFADREIGLRPSPESWLIDASLETNTHDLMGGLRVAADGHPMCVDDLARLDAYGRGPERSRVKRLTGELGQFFGSDLPSEVHERVFELEELANCAHDTNGVPDQERVEEEFRELMAAVRRNTSWTAALDRIQPEDPPPLPSPTPSGPEATS